MKQVDLGKLWRGLNENLALPISLAAVFFTGLSFCSDQREAEEARAITQSVVWRAEALPDSEGVKLSQPNEAVAVQRVTVTFPKGVRADPISLPPNRLLVRAEWLEPGMEEQLKGCAAKDNVVVIEGQLPINVVTHHSVAGRNRIANDVYTLSYLASVNEHGMVDVIVEDIAISGMQVVDRDILPEILDWLPQSCRAAEPAIRPTS